ncbi:hypothetical protein ZIOFF_021898 [Zingiber officinale]|uniref:Uncharacterized protein n=1 Tax=Zingiber officinale TaxID=94328 RepID=A0A8J5H4E8_ZINOF|nr:hypothetical protein ZIOFF_021898 [Zingiber officinale]
MVAPSSGRRWIHTNDEESLSEEGRELAVITIVGDEGFTSGGSSVMDFDVEVSDAQTEMGEMRGSSRNVCCRIDEVQMVEEEEEPFLGFSDTLDAYSDDEDVAKSSEDGGQINLVRHMTEEAREDFTAYADVCFREFGDRVKYWITVNEPNIEPILGHDLGIFPPNHCSSSLASSLGLNCSKGNSSVKPYVAGHNLLLSHASAVSLYRKKYQPNQGGYIGITLLGIWFEPATRLPDDKAAVNRALNFLIGCLR